MPASLSLSLCLLPSISLSLSLRLFLAPFYLSPFGTSMVDYGGGMAHNGLENEYCLGFQVDEGFGIGLGC